MRDTPDELMDRARVLMIDAMKAGRDMATVPRARCPGCGDFGDVAHVAVCSVVARDEEFRRGWERGAVHVLGMLRVQLGRRGRVEAGDLDSLVDAIESMSGEVTRW